MKVGSFFIVLTYLFLAPATIVSAQESVPNAQPFVIPALREWKGGVGQFAWKSSARLVVDAQYREALKPVAALLADDLQTVWHGSKPSVRAGNPAAGDIYFTQVSGDSSLPAEGYLLEIGETVVIKAKDVLGAIWATRSLLQMLEQDSLHKRLPKGSARDFPQYAVRGFVLDVGRKFFSLAFLQHYVKFMSYYKMNDFHIHLNDNGFKQFFKDNWDSTYAAFRLESSTYPQLTSKDGHYTKEEFIELQLLAQRYGVNIIPEIDVPAHSLAFSHAVPGIGSKQYGQDHLDLDNPLTYTVIDNVFKEYLQGPKPVFLGKEVHIGTDEYAKKEAEKFRKFADHYIRFVEGYGKQVRMWGSLTHARGNTPVKANGVTMNLWYNGYAEPKDMFEQGYQGISTPDGWLYIVPAAGYYYDYLRVKKLYEDWAPNKIGDAVFPEPYAPLRGGSFAVWNDHVGNGITEKDVHHRVFPAMQVLAQKMWGGSVTRMGYDDFKLLADRIGEGPGLNMLGRWKGIDSLAVGFDGQAAAGEKKKGRSLHRVQADPISRTIALNGGSSYLATGMPGIGYGYTVSFRIKVADNSVANAVLFGSPDAVVTLNQQGSGLLGFSREGYHYSFNYKLPVNEWVALAIVGNHKGTSLFVNGKLVDKLEGAKRVLGEKKETAKVQTLFFPLEFIGDRANAANATLSHLTVYSRELDEAAIAGLAAISMAAGSAAR